MRKTGFWKADWFLGLVVSLVMLALAGGDAVQSLERKAYDWGVQASSREPLARIAVIAIDDASIANLGRWPWPRDLHAKMADLLAGAKAKVVANTALFFEPQIDPGYAYVTKLAGLHEQALAAGGDSPPLAEMGALLKEAEARLNNDRSFAESLKRANSVVMPMLFRLGDPKGRPDHPLPEYVARNRLPQVGEAGGDALPAASVQYPIEALGTRAVAIGHLNANADVDGGIRAEPLVLRYYDLYFPSLSLLVAAKSLNLGPADIQARLGEEVRLGKLRIPTDGLTQMNTFFYKDRGDKPAFPVDSFYDVLTGKIPASKYQDRIVLIGATAGGVGAPQVTPVSPAMEPVLTLAHSVSSILQEHFFVTPPWGGYASLGVFVLVAFYLIVVLPQLSAGVGALATAVLLTALVGAHFGLMVGAGMWIQLMAAATLLLVGHLLLTTKRFLVTERGKEKSEAESAESNRMLGLAFQGQGQLDMAFDKFRKCPLDDQLLENLYNLALDFERKRQFNKAEAVFRYMAEYRLDFRDLPQRIARAKQMSETVMLGGSGGRSNASTLILNGGDVQKPMLGRYQVEKELGKGAMGVVYLGSDPKINRVVAIKTMALSQEFDEDELADVKTRFFREAETAGRLNHPHIVTIFDAGEEHDLAYIAMEFLKGRDLVPQTKPSGLLPLPQVMGIVARVAEALAYAHRNNVVHRDVKPANIMYEATSDQVKVTDFGIARITDSSKTKTGMVLGTPSYMSPEQLAGKKIDGRSDLFSLGVTLYQLCCGKLPFSGESMAQLMFKIANEPPADIRAERPDLPPCLTAIIDKALAKDVEQRYQSGDEMARDLRECMNAAPAPAAAPAAGFDLNL
ncbi:CHASE2 domain-containing serine/threonine-protein kinase [Azospira restricta]|uniref:non-specific serine/threonine protein kinase n=1 Tax=Azospira restricta TaxID=404405 RepID=A0A974SNN8_9RHOO|nr:serine/threonine-protein kinase [Azospira restricta]QRJ63624.1 CHASE2 domain-containing protein [Azospira restricta]